MESCCAIEKFDENVMITRTSHRNLAHRGRILDRIARVACRSCDTQIQNCVSCTEISVRFYTLFSKVSKKVSIHGNFFRMRRPPLVIVSKSNDFKELSELYRSTLYQAYAGRNVSRQRRRLRQKVCSKVGFMHKAKTASSQHQRQQQRHIVSTLPD